MMRTGTRVLLVLVAVVTVEVIVPTVVAGAVWPGSATGQATSRAQVVSAGNQPVASVAGRSVTVTWPASVLVPGGQPVGGYLVRRYDAAGVPQTIGPACGGTISGLTCTETNVPDGTWLFSVTPVLGNWRGAESATTPVTVAAPTVTSVNPNFGFRTRTQNVAIIGSGFVSGATVAFSGTGIIINSVTFVSATQLTANITISPTAAAGVRNVTVTYPDTGTGTCTNCFTVTLAPIVTSTSPSSRGQGATNQNITVLGNFFLSGATVAFSGAGITVNSVTFVSATQLTANITVSPTAGTAARNVTVTNPAGAGSATCPNCFTVNARPGTFSLNPGTRGQGAANQNIAITGTNFVNGATVVLSGTGITVNSVTFVGATQLTVNITISATAPTGTRSVTVTNPDAGNRTMNNAFTVAAAPVPLTVNPASRGRGTTGNLIVTGTGFVNGAVASFSGTGITVNSTTVNGPTQLTVNATISPTAPIGPRNLTVVNPNAGTGTCTGCFTVT